MSLLDTGAISVCRQPVCDCPATVGRDRRAVLSSADLLSGDLCDVLGTVGGDVLVTGVIYTKKSFIRHPMINRNAELPCRISSLTDSNFIIRQLFKDSY